MRILGTIGVIVTFFSVVNTAKAAKDDLKFITESADIKPVICKFERKPELSHICVEVVKEECPGVPGTSCYGAARDTLIKRMSSADLRIKIHTATLEKFEALKGNYAEKCGSRFAKTKLHITDFKVGNGNAEYDQGENIVKIPQWMLFDSTADEIDDLLANQLGYSCLYSKNHNSEDDSNPLINLDKNAMRNWNTPDGAICEKALTAVESSLKAIETEAQKNCRLNSYEKTNKKSCLKKYNNSKMAYANLMFMNERVHFSHWSRLCKAGESEQLAVQCYIQSPSSSFNAKMCASKKDSPSASSSGVGGK